MSKRRKDTLTGGTGDVKPQYLTVGTSTPSAVDDYSVSQINLPIPRFSGQDKDTATVFELLSVDWYLGLSDIGDTSATHWAFLTTNSTRVETETATSADLELDALDPLAIALSFRHRGFITTGGVVFQGPFHVDTTDGDGNGILIATDRIFLVGAAFNNTVVSRTIAKLKYRQTNVGVMEYIGIVQAQQ